MKEGYCQKEKGYLHRARTSDIPYALAEGAFSFGPSLRR